MPNRPRGSTARPALLALLVAGSTACANLFSLVVPHPDASAEDASIPGFDVAPSDAPGRDGAGPSSDGGTGGGITPRLAGWLDTYRLGGTIDYDGDGTTDVTIVRNADGSRMITVAGPHGPRVVMSMQSLTVYTAQADDDGDGTFDITRSSGLVGGVITRVETRDSDFDGTPDIRTTQTPSTAMIEELTTPPAGGPRQWIVTSATASTRTTMAACAPSPPEPPPHEPISSPGPCSAAGCSLRCLYTDRATLDAHSVSIPTSLVGLGEVRIVTTGTGQCNPRQQSLITDAMGTMEADLGRIRQVNPDRVNQIMCHLSSTHLVYACEVPACTGGAIAFTQGARSGEFDDAETTVTAITTTGYTPFVVDDAVAQPAVREIVIHELFHLYESHEGGVDGYGERDHIYGCSRLAVQWQAGMDYYLGATGDGSSARDGAVCATMDHKPQFGIGSARLQIDSLFYERFPGSMVDQAICAADSMSTPTGFATCGVERYTSFCDQTPVPAAMRTAGELNAFECGVTCPPGTPFVDVPCHAGTHPDNQYDRVGAVGGLGAGCLPVGSSVY